MNGGKVLEQIRMDLRDYRTGNVLPVYIDVFDNSLSHKWLKSLNNLLENNYHLEKNYCFVGFPDADRNGEYIADQINQSIAAINEADIGYTIDDYFDIDNCLDHEPRYEGDVGRRVNHDKFNHLHRYFEDLQGVSGAMSPFYWKADAKTRWHIRQLNLLCHEFETWAKSFRKKYQAPEWIRPSQLMCWLNAPRFTLDEQDYELFGVDTLNRDLGAVFVGVNKAVGKDHWEVFQDEDGADIDSLVTSTLKPQTEAAGDFDIEWANNPGNFPFQIETISKFREWLKRNGFDENDKSLTIGHPQVGQVDLEHSFGTTDYHQIWSQLNTYLDVVKIATSDTSAEYPYHWSDSDYAEQQIAIIEGSMKYENH